MTCAWTILGTNKKMHPHLSANDVARFILNKLGTMTTWKLQKLLYYCQAWSLVWDEKPLFYEDIEAWSNGPVIRSIYNKHRGYYLVGRWPYGDVRRINPQEMATIDAVLKHYGGKSSQWLSDLTHAELPWKHARKGLHPQERGNRLITLESMSNYYSSL